VTLAPIWVRRWPKQKAEEEFKKINEAYEHLKVYHPSSPNQTSQEVNPTGLSDAEPYYNQGMENAKRGRYKEAIHKFTVAIILNPNYAEAHKYRQLAYSKLGYIYGGNSDVNQAAELERKQSKTEPSPAPPPPAPPPTSKSPWRCVHTLTGHLGLVASVAISPDGNTLASGNSDKTIKIWHLGTGKLIRTLIGHSDRVRCVAISPDGLVTVTCHRQEMGQGVRTSIAMVLADELEADVPAL
jgi:WD40 repeat protein